MKAVVAASETSGRALESFLGDAEGCPYLFFYASGEGFEASKEFPTAVQLKKKSLVVHRASANAEITAANYQDMMLFMEFSKNAVWNLHILSHSVYLTVLSNQANQRGWSDLISKDLMDKFHVYLANLHVTSGLMSPS